MIAPTTHMGTVTLSVGDLARSLDFYTRRIGLAVLNQAQDGATLGAGTTPLLELIERPGAMPARRSTGLYHYALLVPSRADLAAVIEQLARSQTPIQGASDHIVSEAIYLADVDGHGIEIYRDRPRDAWYDANGRFTMDTLPLDLDGVLDERDGRPWDGIAAGTIMGHVHLHVSNLAQSENFYRDVVGFDVMAHMPSASFVSAGGYHHHLGMNTWAGVGAPPPPATAARLERYEIVLPDSAALDATVARLEQAGAPLEQHELGWLARDPSANTMLLRLA